MKNRVGTYVMPAIPPYCKEVRVRVRETDRPSINGVMLEELSWPHFLIDAQVSSFTPDAAQEIAPGVVSFSDGTFRCNI